MQDTKNKSTSTRQKSFRLLTFIYCTVTHNKRMQSDAAKPRRWCEALCGRGTSSVKVRNHANRPWKMDIWVYILLSRRSTHYCKTTIARRLDLEFWPSKSLPGNIDCGIRFFCATIRSMVSGRKINTCTWCNSNSNSCSNHVCSQSNVTGTRTMKLPHDNRMQSDQQTATRFADRWCEALRL